MGLCSSSPAAGDPEAAKRSKAVDRAMRKDHAHQERILKLLLLGAGESGKSTLFKQMLLLYGHGFSRADKESYRAIVHSNVIGSMKTLVEESFLISGGREQRQQVPEAAISKENEGLAQVVMELKDDAVITPEVASTFKTLWADPGIKVTYENRHQFQLTDSTDYFLSQLGTISQPEWTPSEEDVLRSRVRTTGIVENKFTIDGNEFAMFDVGGQRNERKKWMHCFDSVTAVLFVAALSAYDLKLFEDESTNRMDEALNLFKEVTSMRWFKNTSIILLLNKKDLFAQKIHEKPLRDYYPDYEGPDGDEEDAAGYIEFMFRENYTVESGRDLYVHHTCATDTNNVEVMFSAVKDTILRRSLHEGGLLS